MEEAHKILIPLREADLDLLEWFAAWTPEVHRANWKDRRQWPPGFRAIADESVYRHDRMERLREEMSLSGDKKAFGRIRDVLLPYRLLEGSSYCARLTPRGRAALKLHGRECPDVFESHCPEIFDDHDLRPVTIAGDTRTEGAKHGEHLPDTAETWRSLLSEYSEGDYRATGSLSAAKAHLSVVTGSQYLNGSLREHHQAIQIEAWDNDRQKICSLRMSMEQFADLLTSDTDTPVTIGDHFGRDGMLRWEPAPPPMSAYRRMQARLASQEESQAARLDEIIKTVEDMKMGKRAKDDLLHALKVAKDLGVKNAAYVAEQTTEEVSTMIESAFTITRERYEAAGMGHLLTGTNPGTFLTGPVQGSEDDEAE